MSAGSHPAMQNSSDSKNITTWLARMKCSSAKQYLFCLRLTFLYTLKNSPPHFQTWTPTHRQTHTSLKDPGRDKESRAEGGGRRRGKSHGRVIKQSSESMVTGVRWEQGRRKKRIQVLSNTRSVSLFSLSFFAPTVNHPPLRAHPRYLSLLQLGSLLRKVGYESGKKRKRRCHYTSKEGL